MKKSFILVFLMIISLSLFSESKDDKCVFLPGSNVYVRIFLFFFPISDKYETINQIEKDSLITELIIRKENIKNEPSTPPIIETDLNIRIKDIPIKSSGSYDLDVTIRCNKKVNFKKASITVYRKDGILILKGHLKNLSIKEISDNGYFKNRFMWKFPFYFDLRYKINE